MEIRAQPELTLQLTDNTSIQTRILNLNCSFDGSQLIYLSGRHLCLHNVFQNSKHYILRTTMHEPISMAFHKAAETTISVISKKSNQTFLEFYFPDKSTATIELHYDLKVHDCMFVQRRKVAILCEDLQRSMPMLLMVTASRKLTKHDLCHPLVKFAYGDRRILLLPSLPFKGCYQFNPNNEPLLVKCYDQYENIKDIVNVDQAEIIIDKHHVAKVVVEQQEVEIIELEKLNKGVKDGGCVVRVGRNLLIASKNDLVIAQYTWIQGQLKYLGVFEYPQRLRASVICMQVSPDEMNVALAVQIHHKDTYTIQFFLFNSAALSCQKKFVNALTRLNHTGSQSGQINSLQNLISSELYLLSGPSIVGYSYMDQWQKRHKYSIHQSPRIVAVHPLGYQLMCTFEGVIKFYQKVQMQLVQIWSQKWSCSAAKYTSSGLLLLCIFQQNTHQLVLYDPNSFTLLKQYSNVYLKHPISSIELDELQSQIVCYHNKDLTVYRYRTGEKIGQFRGKKEGFTQVGCVRYDPLRKWVIVGTKGELVVCRKTQEYHLHFSQQTHITLEHNITSIAINDSIATMFLGTSQGHLLYTAYPPKPQEQLLAEHPFNTINYKQIPIHTSVLTDLIITNNHKYLLAVSKNQGIAAFRIRKHNNNPTHATTYYNSFDISNYNFIETSSQPYLTNIQDKLKSLLEKRKTIFNELQQYKKQWQARRNNQSKHRTYQQKQEELSNITHALKYIEINKIQHQKLVSELKDLEQKWQENKEQEERNHHKDLLGCYQHNDDLVDKLESINQRCQLQANNVEKECNCNLEEIKKELDAKYEAFRDNYQLMKHNLINYNQRIYIEQKEEEMLALQEIQQTRTRLRKEEDELMRKNNELKGYITRNKKQLERFSNRKDFLQNKQRFFRQELTFCTQEQRQLRQIKQELEQELQQLEADTYKKEKRLRKYFIENKMLLKYQLVHDNLMKTIEREQGFIDDEEKQIKNSIGQLQREIIGVCEKKGEKEKSRTLKEGQVRKIKEVVKRLRGRRQYLSLQVGQLQLLLSEIGPQNKQQELQKLYNHFFIQKHLQSSLQSPSLSTSTPTEPKQISQKIHSQLLTHKEYLITHMQKFEQLNAKTLEENQMNYMKYQSQNYALISQCNMRKEQISKKKRIMQQMMGSVRQTQNYIQSLQQQEQEAHRSRGSSSKGRRTHKNRTIPHLLAMSKEQQQPPPPRQIPFVQYEKQQELLMAGLRKQQSEPSLHCNKNRQSMGQVRRMLDIQKIGQSRAIAKPMRRIQTACIKQGRKEEEVKVEVVEEDLGGWMITKPQTAGRRGRGAQEEARRLFSRNKSNSKPTTCTTHSKHSYH